MCEFNTLRGKPYLGIQHMLNVRGNLCLCESNVCKMLEGLCMCEFNICKMLSYNL